MEISIEELEAPRDVRHICKSFDDLYIIRKLRQKPLNLNKHRMNCSFKNYNIDEEVCNCSQNTGESNK